MIRNVCSPDRLVRAVLGVLLLALVFVGPKTLWGLIGALPLVTALLGYCPLYGVLGVSTCRPESPSLRA